MAIPGDGVIPSYDFVHEDVVGCLCAGCCAAEPVVDYSMIGAFDGLPGTARGPNEKALAKLLGLDAPGLGRVIGDIDPALIPLEQQARRIFFDVDDDTTDADQAVDGVLSESAWDRTDLSFGFGSSAADYESNYYDLEAVSTITEFNATQKDVTRDALSQYAAISGLTFAEFSGATAETEVIDADLRFAMSDKPGTAYAYYPSSNTVGGDSFFNKSSYNSPEVGNYAYHTFLHEFGHSLGLKHGQETGSTGAVPYEWDSMEFSVMTYRSYVGKPLNYGYANEQWGYAQSLMMLDIAAIQRMYGANYATNAGDTVYTFSTTTGAFYVNGVLEATPGGNRVFRTIWDGGGTDTYDFSNYTTDLDVDLSAGGYVDLAAGGGTFQRAVLERYADGDGDGQWEYARGHVFNAMLHEGNPASLIENANGGSGNDIFGGNEADNVFRGNGGDDLFYDSLGSDSYFGDAGIDEVIFGAASTIYSYDVVNGFLQIIGSFVDLIHDTVETITFTDQSFGFDELVASVSGNEAPVAGDDSGRVDEDVVLSGLNVLSNDFDPEGEALTVVAIAGIGIAAGGSVTLANGATVTLNADGTLDYDQMGAFDSLNVGETAVETFDYTVSDGIRSSVATVTVTIDGAFDNSLPMAADDGFATGEDSTVAGSVLLNDTDPDGQGLTVDRVNGSAANVGVATLTANGGLITLGADGSFTYDPNGAFDGLETGQSATDSFTYRVNDGAGGTDTATVTITIDGFSPPVATTPVTVDFEGLGDGTAFASQDGLDFDGLTVRASTVLNGASLGETGSNGVFTIDATGEDFDLDSLIIRSISSRSRVTITAYDDGNVVGTDSFQARSNRDSTRTFDTSFDSIDQVVIDGQSALRVDDIDLVTRTIIDPDANQAPVAAHDAFATGEGSAVGGNLMADNGSGADSDPDGDAITVTAVEGSGAGTVTLDSGALVTFAANGDFTYDPNGVFDGLFDSESATDSFVYTLSDPDGATDTASVTITIDGAGTPPPPPPEPTAITFDFESGMTQDGIVVSGAVLTGRAKGVVSGAQAGEATGEMVVSLGTGGDFDFEEAWFTAVSGRNETVTVQGFDNGALAGEQVFSVSSKKETRVALDDAIFDQVDEVRISGSAGVIVDDMLIFA